MLESAYSDPLAYIAANGKQVSKAASTDDHKHRIASMNYSWQRA
jgi:hypothetical protein